MGSPDYPGEEHRREITPPPSHSLPMHGQLQGSDDSDNDSDDTMEPTNLDTNDPHGGYQLLSQDGAQPSTFGLENFAQFSDQEDNDNEDDNQNLSGDIQTTDNNYPNLPNIAPIDSELMRNVWNAPRPAELDIDLDAKRSEEIKAAMSSISIGLQNIAPPEWARNIPENKWIEDLLQEVRKHKTTNVSSTSSSTSMDKQ